MRRQRGFSLVELVAVLMLIAIVAGTAALSISGSMAGAKTRAAVRDLTAALRQTSGIAIVRGEERSVEIGVGSRTYQVGVMNLVQLREDLQMELLTAISVKSGG